MGHWPELVRMGILKQAWTMPKLKEECTSDSTLERKTIQYPIKRKIGYSGKQDQFYLLSGN